VLFKNVRVFDGKTERLAEGMEVLVEGNKIARISKTSIDAPSARIIQGRGRTLMPGLIDAHAHTILESVSLWEIFVTDIGYVHIAAARAAERQLMRGFTTVRDVGGPSFGLKSAIDAGLAKGPRIYPSGATISQTGGHGDFGGRGDVPHVAGSALSYPERVGMTIIADGVDQVLWRAREQLRQGASQIKLMAGGGVASNFDPLDVAQYTEAEMRAAVEAAENWGTYVTVHAYTPRAMQTAVAAGVKCIEHGQLMDEATAKLLAQKRIWLSLQPFLDDEDAIPMSGENREKQVQVSAGTDNAYKLAKKYKIKVAFGTDTLFNAKLAERQGKQLTKLTRWFTPFEVLRMATSVNAELLALSGPRNPYPGKLGVIEEGALADLLLVDGDPLKDISVIANPEQRFVLIMKDGRIYKESTR
jgi:imidazolonepropionase-like amidohydrolase